MNYIKNHIAEGFTIIPNALIRDTSIKPCAKYIYAFLASMSDTWTFLTPELCKALNLNSKTFIMHRDLLIEKHWLYVETPRKENGAFKPKIYHVLGEPDPEFPLKLTDNHFLVDGESPSTKKSVTEKVRDGKTGRHKKKKNQEEKKLKKEKSFFKSDLENFNPNPRLK